MNTIKPSKHFFFWEGKLHRVLRVNRPANLVEAWRFHDRKTVTLLYSDFRMNAGAAINHRQAAKLIGLKPDTLNQYVIDGKIPRPQRSYSLDGKLKPYNKWWSEEDMLTLHDYVITQHRGRPRLDGKITPTQSIASRAEIVAAFNRSQVMYIVGEDGNIVPLFKPPKL